MIEDEEEPRDLYLGRLVDGRYRVTRCIGAGGMGSVYEATQDEMGRKVALKILHVQLAKDPGVLRRFRNEARASATLGHPAIAQAYDFGRTEDGAPFIAMELLDGRDLGEIIEAEGPLAFERAVAIAGQLADALGAAHDAGIVHRDVKPENVLLLEGDAGDVVKVLDFGISKFADGQTSVATRTGTFLGSPSYMAPEQVQDASRADARTDVYALGAVLYAMLSGRPMFSHSSLPMLIVAITNDPPPPLESLRPETPAALLTLVERLTHKSPSERPQSMAEVSEALAELGPLHEAAPRPAPRPTPSPSEAEPATPELSESRVELPVSRRPTVALAALTGTAIAAAIGAYLFSRTPAEPTGEAIAPETTSSAPEAPPEPPEAPVGVDPPPVDSPPADEEPVVEAPVVEAPAATRPSARRRRRAEPSPSATSMDTTPPDPTPRPTEIDGVPIDDSY